MTDYTNEPPQVNKLALSSSYLVPGARRVDLARTATCWNPDCGAPLFPQSFICDDGNTELICPKCFQTLFRVESNVQIVEDDE
jgi:hypothetical protein